MRIRDTNLELMDILTRTVQTIVNNGMKDNNIQDSSNGFIDAKKNTQLAQVIAVQNIGFQSDGSFSYEVDVQTVLGQNYNIYYKNKNTEFKIPNIGSSVLMDFVDNTTPYITFIDDVQQYINITSIKIILDSPDIYIGSGNTNTVYLNNSNGSNDGLVKINELTNKLNKLITEVTAMKNDYTTHAHPYVNVVTPAVTSAPSVPFTGTFTNFDKNDYENTKVKQ